MLNSKGLTMFKIVEKNNYFAVHCLCDSLERAQHWIDVKAVEYCLRGYFTDKTLTPESFMIVEA